MNLNRKSRGTSFLLTLLFGPLGLLYSSVIGGIVLTVVAIATAPSLVGPILCWVAAIIWGDYATQGHNKSVDTFLANARPLQASEQEPPTKPVRAQSQHQQTTPCHDEAHSGIRWGELFGAILFVVLIAFVIPNFVGKEADESILKFYSRIMNNPDIVMEKLPDL